MFKKLIIFSLLAFSVIELYAQKHPFIPSVSNFNYKDYKGATQNWAVTEDKRGVIYVGNQLGVFTFDGNNWSNIPAPNSSVIRSLASDEEGTIFAGAVGEFGFLYHNIKSDSLAFYSLKSILPEGEKEFGDVWKTYCANGKVFFQTFSKVFVYDKKSKFIEVLKPFSESGFHLSFLVNSTFFVNDKMMGLCSYQEGKLVPVSGGDSYAQKRIYAMLPNDKEIWIATRENGIELLNEKTGTIAPFVNLESNEILRNSQIYNAISLSDSLYGFATLNNGLFVLNKKGEIIFHLNKSNQTLIDQNIKNLFFDSNKRLWLALDNGLSVVDFSSDIFFLNDRLGVHGAVNKMTHFNENIFVGTTQGLYRVSGKNIAEISGVGTQCWDLLAVNKKENSLLLAATTNGIFHIDEESANKLDNAYTFCLTESKKHKGLIYAGTYSGVVVFQLNGKNLEYLHSIEGITSTVRSLQEDENGVLWAGVPTEGVYKIEAPYSTDNKATKYGLNEGLETVDYDVVFKTSKGIKIGTYFGVYVYDSSTNKFVKDTSLGKEFYDGKTQVFSLKEDSINNRFFAHLSNSDSKMNVCVSDDNVELINTKLQLIKNIETHSFLPISGAVWFGGADGIQVYMPFLGFDEMVPKTIFISNVSAGKDSIIHSGFFSIGADPFLNRMIGAQPEESIFSLSYSLNTILFHFSSPEDLSNKTVYYSSMLEGYETDWSEWSLETKRNYTNLYEGTYVFKVKSKNVFGVESEVTTYTFIIKAPWYRTWWAYALYSVLAIVLVFGIVQMSLYRIKKQKELLEKTVKERTKEIQQQKAEIEIQKQVVEEKNKDITDSIQYAKKIQVAILPSEQALSSYFKEHFVLFKPRDIVSGDFFWAHQSKNKVVWIAADCTGHGVPGAFMSMIGTSLLNEIVIENGVFKADLILNEMREKIIKALGQTGAAGQQKDGMDLALCVLDKETGVLSFSGANNPLWIFREENGVSDCQEFKADKQPIGYLTEEKKPFTCHEIQTQKGDLILTFTDGFADQFGGPKGKKYMYKPFRNLIAANMSRPVGEIKTMLDEEIERWKNHPESEIGHVEQIDDICIFGVRI